MPNPTNTLYSDLSAESDAFLVKRLLDRARHEMIIEQFCSKFILPGQSTKNAEWTRAEALPNAVKELVEGVQPAGTKPVFSRVRAELKQYGDYIPFSDFLELTHTNPVLQAFTDQISQQASEMIERSRIEVARSCSNRFFTAGTAINGVNAVFDLAFLRKIVRALDKQKAKEITPQVKAGPNIDTRAVAKSYICLVHSDAEPDLRNLNASTAGIFVPVENYAGITPYPTEIGKVERIRFLRHTLVDPLVDQGASQSGKISTSGSVADVYPMIFLGENALGTVALEGYNSIKILPNNPRPQFGDALAQQGSIGWKAMTNTVILNDMWMAVGYTALTA